MFDLRFALLFIIYFQCALSLRIIKLNNEADDNFLPTVTKNIYSGDKSNNNPVININKLSKSFLGKVRLVSRVIPHGYNSAPYEYDSKLNTLYKPLIRFHVRKPINEVKDDKTSKLLGYAVVINKNNDKNKNRNANHAKYRAKLNDYNDLHKLLRKGPYKKTLDTLIDKSNEDFDDLRPGLAPFSEESHERTTKAPVVIPVYPFWNYWTYAKTIHQDDCPGNLVKLGEMCISVAGHRKSNIR